MESDGNQIEFDITKISLENMHNILRYLGHHKGVEPGAIAKPIRSSRIDTVVDDEWDAEYVNKMNKKAIFQVILAANYLDCPSLLHLGTAKIATLIKGKSPEEIKNILADNGNDDGKDEEKDATKDTEQAEDQEMMDNNNTSTKPHNNEDEEDQKQTAQNDASMSNN
eukprot:CAMPEP_0201571838 /NCGR_PEP_ID=MMETSP0190_2-20130828/14804_1 /ASSEMBLY_ACC=CAM_ASM_000263 /TAXON_ID=37353 /ORGANISM="Rosalina sp." /LENGTH=166 /DNA_ID=CAMNT_0047996935 /DNA_START=305 /DNA_END=802 /DNA_ORIENTATION=-